MLIIDTETYSNYFLLSALNPETGNITRLEMYEGHPFDKQSAVNLMARNLTVGFNSNKFDLVMIIAAIKGFDCAGIKKLANRLIVGNETSYKLLRGEGWSVPHQWDHVDLIEVAPGVAGLKVYGGRLNAPTIQDLPIEPDTEITPAQRELMRDYCDNDLYTTELLRKAVWPAIELRTAMSEQYGMDLRSKSDAQIAETIIKSELHKITGKDYTPKGYSDEHWFKFLPPAIIGFKTPMLTKIYLRLQKEMFRLGSNGALIMPQWLRETRIPIGKSVYQMGIGGLHSCEKSQFVCTDDDHVLMDWDVASYYPSIILQQRLSPESMGKDFLTVYQDIVTRRIEAKHSGDKVTADTLKIAANGSFGKLGSKYSALYAPDLLLQTTLTGQLALLMLIERLEGAGIKVISANTDGIVVHHHTNMLPLVDEITWEWMLDTSFSLESTRYRSIASRDVNNYVAVKMDGGVKGKGVFANTSLAKNPDMSIVPQAVAMHLATGIPISSYVTDCLDISKFISVRRVTGGAVWRDEYLGKAVRFYISKDVPADEAIRYAKNSNKVPKSDGARPLMQMSNEFPDDINHDYYIKAAEDLLKAVGVK